ncbi:hypothetical protein BDQ12DRAFT_596624 [Crucibulum laeve]|uniref:Aminomethyltransferase folate-binding domain-containing protein n=1 Tax=Crucibulum laeve TaxID=68775 RepID=A0A5C3MI37_9AGAR|nr:hypothetical protein BDQ12DRAFT_596624 [Crucibulum laeve]
MVPPALRGLLRSTPTIAPIPHRGILSVFGPQASEFLNGLLATSIREPIKGPIFSTFLHAQAGGFIFKRCGRVLYDVFLYSADSNGKRGYLLEYDARPSEAPPLLSYIKRHVLRSKVKVRDVSGEYDVWAAWGAPGDRLWESKRNWDWARSGAVEPVWDTSEMWPWGTASHDLVTEESYALHRILHGVPEGSTEIVPMQAFPMDSNLDVMGGLDFRKGCYVGQELTVRTYHTGVIRKRILPVVIHPQDQYVLFVILVEPVLTIFLAQGY